MGYCYTKGGALVCDACGEAGGVRRRTCPYTVSGLPFCPAPALCGQCYAPRRKRLHADCKAGAARAQRADDARARAIEGGAFLVRAAWGDWHGTVPAGEVGVLFEGRAGARHWALVSAHAYDRRGPLTALGDFEALPWSDPDGA